MRNSRAWREVMAHPCRSRVVVVVVEKTKKGILSCWYEYVAAVDVVVVAAM